MHYVPKLDLPVEHVLPAVCQESAEEPPDAFAVLQHFRDARVSFETRLRS